MSEPTAFERAKAIHAEGRLEEAAAAYGAVPDDSPDAARALNNLGTIYETMERFEDAEAVYRQAIAILPDSPIIWYNLGHALHRMERLSDAVLAYLQSLEYDPGNGNAHYNLGNALADQARHESAVGCYRRALECGLNDPRVESNLGTSLLDLGRPGEALAAFRRAVEADPAVAEEWFHVGLALEALRAHDEAAESYRKSLELNPDAPSAREGLARTLNAAGRSEAALIVYRNWLEQEPDNPIARHMIAALSGDAVPDRADDAYVRTVFDDFAETFDRTLARLQYRAPQLLADLLKQGRTDADEPVDVLDAGCGTGLVGPFVKPFARTLTGVDLSPGMLAHASRRGVYDALHEAELCDFLRHHPGQFDVIVAADTINYFGDLLPVLAATAAVLRPGGRFLFSLEDLVSGEDLADDETIRLNDHGRYAHSEPYLRDCLAKAGLKPASLSKATIRTESAVPVTGLFVDAIKEF
jgi:predicted TPR repeat methyltransferase